MNFWKEMKTLLTLLIVLPLAAFAQFDPVEEGYNLVWSDEFDGTEVDTSKWQQRGKGSRGNGYVTWDAASLDGEGNLVMSVWEEDSTVYTGMIATQKTQLFKFGYFEARIKLSDQPGMASAFWLQSPNFGKEIGNTEDSGVEIDIVEYRYVDPEKSYHSLHWDGYGEFYQRKSSSVKHKQLDDGEYHTFGCIWDEKGYTFYVDGKKSKKLKNALSHTEQYIILSVEVNDWGGDVGEAELPETVLYDYVRVYQLEEEIED